MNHTTAAGDFSASLQELSCSICHENYGGPHVPVAVHGFRHVFGKACLEEWLASENPGRYGCPDCRQPLLGWDAAVPSVAPVALASPTAAQNLSPQQVQAESRWSLRCLTKHVPTICWDLVEVLFILVSLVCLFFLWAVLFVKTYSDPANEEYRKLVDTVVSLRMMGFQRRST